MPWPRAERRRASIGLTPLIDVVFILLIFFMLASSFLDWRSIQVSAGTTGAAAARPGLTGALLVDIRADGLRLSGAPVTPAELSRQVAARIEARADQRIVVVAPGDVLVAFDPRQQLGVRHRIKPMLLQRSRQMSSFRYCRKYR